jgi:hypothetical protein
MRLGSRPGRIRDLLAIKEQRMSILPVVGLYALIAAFWSTPLLLAKPQ